MGDVARQAAGGAQNILVIEGKNDVSTYALIARIDTGLVWMSTVGVDMVLRGKHVIAAARPKYTGLGLVDEPTSVEDYFEALERCALGLSRPTEEQLRMAERYLVILNKEFSYNAFSKGYRAKGAEISGCVPGDDADTFFKVLAGDLPAGARPPLRGKKRAP